MCSNLRAARSMARFAPVYYYVFDHPYPCRESSCDSLCETHACKLLYTATTHTHTSKVTMHYLMPDMMYCTHTRCIALIYLICISAIHLHGNTLSWLYIYKGDFIIPKAPNCYLQFSLVVMYKGSSNFINRNKGNSGNTGVKW